MSEVPATHVVAAERRSRERGSRLADLEALYRAEHPGMVRLAHLILGSNEVAEEVVHDAFLKLHGAWRRVDRPGAYLRQIVVNECRSRLRRLRVERRHLPDPPRPEWPAEVDETWVALARVRPRRRAALVLRYYEDLPLAEIAELLGCRLGTVKSLIHRGLAELKEVLGDA